MCWGHNSRGERQENSSDSSVYVFFAVQAVVFALKVGSCGGEMFAEGHTYTIICKYIHIIIYTYFTL